MEALTKIGHVAAKTWAFELFAVGGRSITVSNVVVALFFFFIGLSTIKKKRKNISAFFAPLR